MMNPLLARRALVSLAVSCLCTMTLGSDVVRAQQGPIATSEPGIGRAEWNEVARVRQTTALEVEIARETARTSEQPLVTQCLLQMQEAPARVGSFGCYWTSLRMRTPEQINDYFGGMEIGGAVALGIGRDRGALYTELISDNLWIASWPGYARIGLSAQVSAASDTTTTTVTQFFQGGGNAVLYAAIPTAAYLNFVMQRDTAALLRRLDLFTTVALGADVPAMSTAASETGANLRVGLNLQGVWNSSAQRFGFFGAAHGGIVAGLSQGFYENLTGSSEDRRRPFLAGSGTVGVDLSKLVRIGMSFGGATLTGVSQKPQLSIQLIQQ